MEQEKRIIYLLCRQYFEASAFYGIFTDKHLLIESYYRVLKKDHFLKEHPNHIAIYEFETNAFAGEFLEYGEDTPTFYEGYKKIGIEELETED